MATVVATQRDGHNVEKSAKNSLSMVSSEDMNGRDALALAKSGKQQVLKRRFGLVSMIGFSCGLMCTWEGILVGFLLGFGNGGPAGLIYGFFIIWIGNLSVFIVMGELASMVPTAGGQYHWVSLLAPPSIQRSLSYTTGWITVAGWIVGTTAGAFFVSSLIQGLMVLNIPSYEAVGWQGTLILWGVLVICLIMNTVGGKALPAIEIGVLILHVLGFFAILVPLVSLAPKTSAHNVFTVFQNAGGWKTQALSFFIGLQGNAAGFVGTDGAIHMSEEVKDSQKNVPRSMILSILINGVLAFGMLLAILFASGNLENLLEDAPNGYPFITIFANTVGSNAGATGMTAIIVVLELCSTMGALAAASRMMWSFARDRGLPGHAHLSKVDSHTTVPLYAVFAAFVCAALIGLINIGSSTGLNIVISLVLVAFYTSYLIACGLLLFRRIKGDIGEQDADPTSDQPCQWGPWRLRGFLGTANNIVACAYLILIAFFSLWPTAVPVTATTMNYSSAVLGGTAILSMIYYFIWARKTYTGPIVEVKVEQI